jgi:hypothetical protein
MHGVERTERVARLLAITAAVALVGLVTVLLTTEITGAHHALPPSALRRGVRLVRGLAFVVPIAAIVLLAAFLLMHQLRDRTWRSPGTLAVYVIGGVLLIAGIANLAPLPWSVFPSQLVCVYNYDLVLCDFSPWAGAPFAVIVGAALILIGVQRNRLEGARHD